MLKITNARVYSGGEFIDKDVFIEASEIVAIGSSGKQADETIDANGQWLLPGLIDTHVHMREPGTTHKEDFLTGSKAALAGRFTTVIDMPNNPKPTTTLAALKEKQQLAKKAKCEVFFHFGADKDNFEEVKKARPNSMKLYFSETTGNIMRNDPKSVERHFQNFDNDKPIVVHAEGNRLEVAIKLAKKYEHKVHLAHAPTADAVTFAKSWSKCTVEITPHHLFLSSRFRTENPGTGAVKPPLQPDSSRKKLWNVLEQVDTIGSDHAPHTLDEKAKGAYGFPGLETTFGLMLNAYYEKKVRFQWLMQRLAENPAKIFNLGKRGEIKTGNVANMVLFDPKKEWVVIGEELETKCKWSPYEGRKLRGRTTYAIVNGKMVYENSEWP